jgi:hypothetical protein
VSAALRKLTRISFRTLELAREGFPSEGKSHHRALHAPRRASREAREHRGGQAGRPGSTAAGKRGGQGAPRRASGEARERRGGQAGRPGSTAAGKRGGQGAPPIEQAKRVLLPVCAAEQLAHPCSPGLPTSSWRRGTPTRSMASDGVAIPKARLPTCPPNPCSVPSSRTRPDKSPGQRAWPRTTRESPPRVTAVV